MMLDTHIDAENLTRILEMHYTITTKQGHEDAPAGCWEELKQERHETCTRKSFPEHLEDMQQKKITNEDDRQLTELKKPRRGHLQQKQKFHHNPFLQSLDFLHPQMNFLQVASIAKNKVLNM